MSTYVDKAIKALSTYISRIAGASKISLAIGVIGFSSFIVAIILFVGHNTTQSNLVQVGAKSRSSESQGVEHGSSRAGATLAGQAGNNTAVGSSSVAATKNAARTKINSTKANGAISTGSSASTNNSNSQQPSGPFSSSTPTPTRTGYNLNEPWFFASIGAAGDYNRCWPDEITSENESRCLDSTNEYSGVMFEGIGISRSDTEAEQHAAAQLDQKLAEKHIVPRRGGGGDAVILTEELCTSYSLSCSRW